MQGRFLREQAGSKLRRNHFGLGAILTSFADVEVDPAYRSGGYIEIDGDEADVPSVPDGTALGDDDRLAEAFAPSYDQVAGLEQDRTAKDALLDRLVGSWTPELDPLLIAREDAKSA